MYVVRMWFVDLADLRMRLKMLLLLLLERSGERTAEDAGGFSSLERTNEHRIKTRIFFSQKILDS